MFRKVTRFDFYTFLTKISDELDIHFFISRDHSNIFHNFIFWLKWSDSLEIIRSCFQIEQIWFLKTPIKNEVLKKSASDFPPFFVDNNLVFTFQASWGYSFNSDLSFIFRFWTLRCLDCRNANCSYWRVSNRVLRFQIVSCACTVSIIRFFDFSAGTQIERFGVPLVVISNTLGYELWN